ncbi:hypothetical protein [Streptomyces winkii]|uniref:hypothetical protein n=1 Tax=Streptomyces winkii TaxID=3051178 RepID=UPI0028D24C01|nr:hypothetical protein [Streptomyces sp. DSM 40971]
MPVPDLNPGPPELDHERVRAHIRHALRGTPGDVSVRVQIVPGEPVAALLGTCHEADAWQNVAD